MSSNKNLKNAHNTNLDKAAAYLELLRLAGTADCTRLTAQLRDAMDESIGIVDSATRNRTDAKVLKKAFVEADKKLKSTVAGTYAIIEGSDEKLFDKLPAQENWSKLAGVQQAEHLIKALETAGKDGKPYIANIEVVARRRELAEKAWVAAGSKATAMHTGETAVAKLKSVIAQADVILRPLCPPGSPLAQLLKEARGGGKKKHAAKPAADKTATDKTATDKNQPQSPEQHAGGSTGSDESATPAPLPPLKRDGSGEVAVVSANGSAPAMLNGVHA